MATLLQRYVQPVTPCSYLADRDAALDTRLMLQVSPEEYEVLLVRGWRRFGPAYFRPQCAPCNECVPLRVPTDRFAPSKSQRRAKKNCAALRVEISPPRVDRERLELYHRWHRFREDERGWMPSVLDERAYAIEFALPHPCGRELAYYDDDPPDGRGPKLVGIGLCDQTPRCWSAVYFFYDPDYADRSLGTANVVRQLEHARSQGIPHVYLGYRVAACPSLRYKGTYRPAERLANWPGVHEAPAWVPFEPETVPEVP